MCDDGSVVRGDGRLLELELLRQLPLTRMLYGVQLYPCHELSAWVLSSSCIGWGSDHGSHGDCDLDHGGHGDGDLV